MIRHVIDTHIDPIPAVLEIPSKECPYDASKDSILRRAKVTQSCTENCEDNLNANSSYNIFYLYYYNYLVKILKIQIHNCYVASRNVFLK